MRISIHQPVLLPWAGYWHKLASSDLVLHLASTQYDDEYGNRFKVENNLVTVPVMSGAKDVPMYQVSIAKNFRKDKLIKTIQQSYVTSKNSHSHRIEEILDAITGFEGNLLLDFNVLLHDIVKNN